jgi:xylulokinase
MNAEAISVPPGCEGLTFLPYLSGERCPHNDPLARGAFAGLTLAHSKAHLARAVFEGATFGLADCLDRLVSLGVKRGDVRVSGGGARSDLWMQMLSDVLQVGCARVQGDVAPALGAAIMAGVGTGVWPDVQSACRRTVKLGDRFEPSEDAYGPELERYRSLYPTLKVWNKA